MKLFAIAASLFILLTSISLAQNDIAGLVVDSLTKKPIAGARLQLLSSSRSISKGALSGRDGTFAIKKVEKGTYSLTIKMITYKAKTVSVTMAESDVVNLGTIRLQPADLSTGVVEVVQRATRADVRGDTTEFNASAYKTNPDATAEDLIKKMPGVQVETDGTVKAQGENVRRVLVDGKPFFGDDPTAALKNLPSEIISSVQVIDGMNDQSRFTGFDDGDRIKTLNIVTKEDKRNGQFGKVYGGFGENNRYSGGGNINIFDDVQRISFIGLANNVNQQNFSIQDILGATGNSGSGSMQRMGSMMRMFGGGSSRGGRGGGPPMGSSISDFLVPQGDGITSAHSLGVNYADSWAKNFNVSGSYFFNYSDNSNISTANKQYFLADIPNQISLQNNSSTSNTMNHRLNFRMDYSLDSLNSFSFVPRVTFQNTDTDYSTLNQTISEDNVPINASDTRYVNNNFGLNMNAELSYRRRFEIKGRTFSATANISYNNNAGDGVNNAVNTFYQEINSAVFDTLSQRSNNLGNGNSAGINIAYTEPVFGSGIVQLSYNGNTSRSFSDKQTFSTVSGIESEFINPELSNNFVNTYTTHRPGLNYRFTIGDGNLSLGSDYQYALLGGEQRFPSVFSLQKEFHNILPSLSANWRFSMTDNLRLNYRTSTNAPSVSQLQTVVDNSDPLRLSSGNSALEQEFNHNVSLRFHTVVPSSAESFFGFVSATLTQDKIANSTIVAGEDTLLNNGVQLGRGAQFTAPTNMNGYLNARSFFVYGFPYDALKLNVNINTGVVFTRDVSTINSVVNNADNWAVNSGFGFASNISENIDFTFGYRLSFNSVVNSIQSELNNEYFLHFLSLRGNIIIGDGFVLFAESNYSVNTGLSENFNQAIPLINMGFGKKFFDNAAELRLSMFDVLNQNNSINRNIGANYLEDVQTIVLRRYAMLTFTWNLRSFGNSQPRP